MVTWAIRTGLLVALGHLSEACSNGHICLDLGQLQRREGPDQNGNTFWLDVFSKSALGLPLQPFEWLEWLAPPTEAAVCVRMAASGIRALLSASSWSAALWATAKGLPWWPVGSQPLCTPDRVQPAPAAIWSLSVMLDSSLSLDAQSTNTARMVQNVVA